MSANTTGTCSICQGQYLDFGNNAAPFAGRCCSDCNNRFVIPARIMRIDNDDTLALLTAVACLGRTLMVATSRMGKPHLVEPEDPA